MPRHGFLFTHGWCRHLFAQHPPLRRANVTQPMVQNAPAELLNNVEPAAAGDLEITVRVREWERGRERRAEMRELYELSPRLFSAFLCTSLERKVPSFRHDLSHCNTTELINPLLTAFTVYWLVFKYNEHL